VTEALSSIDRIYRKTDAGGEEIRHRQVIRDVTRRSVLLLVNGLRTMREVGVTLRLPEADVHRYLSELLDLGLIEAAPPLGYARAEVSEGAAIALPDIERIFVQFMGPLAPMLVRKHAGEAWDRADLITRLAAHLNDQAQRQAFIEAVARLH
jgi:hypothetical protein